MMKKVIFSLALLSLMSSCVSKKIYNDLENKYTDLKKENRILADENDELRKANSFLSFQPVL